MEREVIAVVAIIVALFGIAHVWARLAQNYHSMEDGYKNDPNG